MDMGNGTIGGLSESRASELRNKGVHIFTEGEEVWVSNKSGESKTLFKIRNIGRRNIVIIPIAR